MTKPPERIHSEPGRFWIISDGMDFDPLASMQGILTIKDDGQSELELLPQIWSWVISLDEVISGRHIEIGGQLHRIDQNVRMTRVWLQSYSPVKLSSLVSLMVPGDLVLLKHSQSIKMLTIPLENTWPWLGIPMPVGERIDQHYTIRYPLPEYKSFKISNADVHLTSSYNVNYDMQMRAANVKPYAEIEFDFDTPITITSAQGICLDFEDLLVLLTNQECGLEWPKASIPDSDASGSLYFSRRRKVGGTVSHLYCWVPYPEIEHAFGSILDDGLRRELNMAQHSTYI